MSRIQTITPPSAQFAEDELRGFSRSTVETEWLLLVLTLLYISIPTLPVSDHIGVVVAAVLFAIFVLTFNYVHFFKLPFRWKLRIELVVMTIYITVILRFTGGADSLLFDLYYLVIITSAIALSRRMTAAQVVMVLAGYLILIGSGGIGNLFALNSLAGLISRMTPVVLVAYITSMLANDSFQAWQHVRELAETDELTGLFNLRAFMKFLERDHDKAVRYARTYGILMLDADNLKSVNDHYGHEEGNRLLRRIALAVQGAVRATDIVARYGGDEFIVLLPEVNTREVDVVVRRIEHAVRGSATHIGDNVLEHSVSIGAALYPQDGTDVEQLIRRADQHMYRVKSESRAIAR